MACAGPKSADSAGDDPCLPGGEPELLIGVGEQGYEPLTPGDGVELVHGPQGGYHLVLALRAHYLDASSTWTVRLTGEVDGELLGETVPYANPRCDEDSQWLEAWNLLLIWNTDVAPEDLVGREADVSAEVTDAAGTVISASTWLVIEDNEDP